MTAYAGIRSCVPSSRKGLNSAELLCYAAVEGTPEMMYLLWRNYPSRLKKTKDMFILHTAVACNVVENVSVLVASDLSVLDVNELPSKDFDKS
jgi:hypothetical protein